MLRVRPRLLPHARHRVGVELADRVERPRVQPASSLQHRLRTPLFERGIVQEGVGLRGEDPAGEGGWLRCVNGHALDGSILEPAEQDQEAVHVHRFVQAIVDGLAHEWMVHGDD